MWQADCPYLVSMCIWNVFLPPACSSIDGFPLCLPVCLCSFHTFITMFIIISIIKSSWNLPQTFILWNACSICDFRSKGQRSSWQGSFQFLCCLLRGSWPISRINYIFDTILTRERTMCRGQLRVIKSKVKIKWVIWLQGQPGNSSLLSCPLRGSMPMWPTRIICGTNKMRILCVMRHFQVKSSMVKVTWVVWNFLSHTISRSEVMVLWVVCSFAIFGPWLCGYLTNAPHIRQKHNPWGDAVSRIISWSKGQRSRSFM